MRTPSARADTLPSEASAATGTSSQPMSAISLSVRSTSLVRSLLIAGSMSKLGFAVTSQCDTDEPGASVLGVYMSTCPAGSEPAWSDGSLMSVTLRPTRLALSVLPSAWVTRTDGIVIVGSAPPRSAGGQPGALSATMTGIAP